MTVRFFNRYDNETMKKAARKKKESFFEKVEEQIAEVIPHEEKKMKGSMLRNFTKRRYQVGGFLLFSFLIVVILVGYNWLQNGKQAVGADGKLNSEAVKALVDEVGDKMEIPQNETPTIATVTDVTKLSDQPFFRNAKNGDKVMIFGSTKEAILYRPSIHKIIAVAPINGTINPSVTPAQATTSGTLSVTPSPTEAATKLKVAVLNSTKTGGLAKKASDLLDKEKYDVLSTSNAQGEYKTTTVSSISKDKKITDSDLRSVAATFSKVKASVSSLPSGEAAPAGADVVIIVGSDFASSY